ncbi:hypothetical protein [Actinoplanes solisilvae]|uniref:hypothetical protein n=1 Tax=Actinoplanes solisilvae TaxID=2486853 RepID=UPI000FD824C0|nr:hypothetical protein [Actinoplanes solisilvae]
MAGGGGSLIWSVGLERSLTAWNDQLALLPWGLHRILGIVTFLEIPPSLPIWITATGVVLTLFPALPAMLRTWRL